MSKRPIKVMQVNAPPKDTDALPSTFARFLLIPEYRAMQEMWPDKDIHLEVIINENTVGKKYFAEVNDILYYECADLASRYILVKK